MKYISESATSCAEFMVLLKFKKKFHLLFADLKMSFIGQLKNFYDDSKIMEYEYSNPNNLTYFDVKYNIGIEDKLLMPKFRFKRDISFNILPEDMLLTLYEITEHRSRIDRWYVYQLIDILLTGERIESIIHSIKSLKLLLNKRYDNVYKEKLLTSACFEEYPDIEIFFNACYGDYFIQNNHIEFNVEQEEEIKYSNNFFISFELPQVVINYIEFDPLRYNADEEELSFFDMLLALLEKEREQELYICKWPQFETVEEYVQAYKVRNNKEPDLEYKVGSLIQLQKTLEQLKTVFKTDYVTPFMLSRALKRYLGFINREHRFLLVGNLLRNDIPIVFHNAD